MLVPVPSAGEAPPPPGLPCRVLTYQGPGPLGRAAGVLRAGVSGRPLQNGLFGSADLAARLAELAPRVDVVTLQLVRLAGFLPALGDVPLIVDFIDSLALNLETRAARDRPWLAPLLRLEAARLARAEERMLGRAGRGIVVCRRDRDAMGGRLPPALAARLEVVPLAFESGPSSFWPPAPRPTPARSSVVFTGNLGYFPNLDAAFWLIEELWPRLRKARPEVSLSIAGDRPPARLLHAARRAGVEIEVSPADLGPVLAGATLALAPLACGSGQPLKILEAWRLGVPVVASSWAAAGTTAEPGRDLLIADGPDAWVEAISRLLGSVGERARLAESAYARLVRDYAPQEVATSLEASLRGAFN